MWYLVKCKQTKTKTSQGTKMWLELSGILVRRLGLKPFLPSTLTLCEQSCGGRCVSAAFLLYCVWSKLWPWNVSIQTDISAFNLRTCKKKKKKATNCCLSIFHPQHKPSFCAAWKHCTGCEVIVRWAHAGTTLPSFTKSTRVHRAMSLGRDRSATTTL